MVEKEHLITAGYTIFFIHHAEELIGRCRDARIGVIVLKGIALADSVYAHAGLRRMADIDILVRQSDAGNVHRVLCGLGYICKDYSKGALFVKEGPPHVCVDVHTAIPYAREEEIWAAAREIRLGDSPALTLSLEETIIYLCYHCLVHHGTFVKRWIEDIHRFIEFYKDDIPWQSVVGKIKAYRMQDACYWCFKKAEALFRTSIPDDVFVQLKPRTPVYSRLFARLVNQEKPVPYIDYITALSVHPLRYFLSVFFPSVTLMRLRYNKRIPWVYFYYLIRPLELLYCGLRGLAGAMFTN